MANSLCFSPLTSFKPHNKPGLITGRNSTPRKVLCANDETHNCKNVKFQALEVKATDSNQTTKTSTLICADCDGNAYRVSCLPNQPGIILCKQCVGSGVNSVDHFNGQFKAGGLCWLCRGKKEILCGNCNGAGFVGGYLSSFED